MNQNRIKGQQNISKHFGIFRCRCKEEISLQNIDSYTSHFVETKKDDFATRKYVQPK